ncbi:hypothetical protein [Paenarthrobacter aurescens]|uniref:Uncharacterized protein n=1 Tax=Paenarthrobacter aurescens TaxID=43663 RepID=A0A4Y3NBP4_PAEAU|nr:hypothetical protein [Paenarthrobacter aurescens]GEB17805.1 hypothetical protein AAU01_05600 [Paenarthrobacter aurescens]
MVVVDLEVAVGLAEADPEGAAVPVSEGVLDMDFVGVAVGEAGAE